MSKPSIQTIIRTVFLIITWLNQLLTMYGKNPLPFSANEIYIFLTSASTLAASFWTWWKNQSFTQSAIKADEYLEELRESSDLIDKK